MQLSRRDILHKRLHLVLIILFAVTFPFHIQVSNIFFIAFAANWLLEGNLLKKLSIAVNNKWVLLFSGFYLLHIVGLLFSSNIGDGLFDLEKKAALFAFPFILVSVNFTIKQVHYIILSFIIACFILTAVCFAFAAYQWLENNTTEFFFSQELALTVDIHRVYLSMYLLFCIFSLLYIKSHIRLWKQFFINAVTWFLIIYFLITIFLLGSRILIALTLISSIIYIAWYVYRYKKVIAGLSVLFVIFLLVSLTIYHSERYRTLFRELYTDLDKGKTEFNTTGPNLRLEVWKNVKELLKEKWYGVGTGDVTDELVVVYKRNEFNLGAEARLNAHSQYLETWLGLGPIGLFTLLAGFIFPLYWSFKRGNYYYGSYIILFAIVCFTESLLCRNKGIMFYGLFNSLFIFAFFCGQKNQAEFNGKA